METTILVRPTSSVDINILSGSLTTLGRVVEFIANLI